MPNYVITARAAQGPTFSDNPGQTSFLEVPDGARTTSPIQAIPRDAMSAGNPESESIYRHCIRLTNYANPFDEVLQLSNVKRVGLAARTGRVGLPADAPRQAVNIDCGEYYQAMIQTRSKESIIGYPSHSWHVGDPVFTEDLAHTLNGDPDRSAIRTRLPLPNGQFKLVKPQTLVATAASTGVSVPR